MKIISKISVAAVLVVFLFSCAKTRDGLGIDTINNIVRTGKWTKVNSTFYPVATPTVGVTTDLVSGSQYAKFKSDDKVHFYNGDDTEFGTKSYFFIDTKTIVFDGTTFKIDETLGGTISKMTLVNQAVAGRTVVYFQR